MMMNMSSLRTNIVEAHSPEPSDYNFMDLLKDNGLVPEIAEDKSTIMPEIENRIGRLVEYLRQDISDYGFMDLLKDKGHIPLAECVLPTCCNDNDRLLREAS